MKKQHPARRLILKCGLAAILAIVVGALASTALAEKPHNSQAPSISGTPVEGQTLTGSNGSWLYSDGTSCHSECSYTWQWQRCNAGGGGCVDIPGVTSQTYVLTSADVGNRPRVVVTMHKIDCDARNQNCKEVTDSAPSSPTAVVQGRAPTTSTPPTIGGTVQEGQVLTATPPAFSGTQPITTSFQWLLCDPTGATCGPITGATAQTYTVRYADVGYELKVAVAATNAAGTLATTSNPTAVVTPLLPTPGHTSRPVSQVVAPNKLVIGSATTSLDPLGRIVLDIRVDDLRGFHVKGALVDVTGGRFAAAPEKTTGHDGLVHYLLHPAKGQAGKTLTIRITVTSPTDTAGTLTATKTVTVQLPPAKKKAGAKR